MTNRRLTLTYHVAVGTCVAKLFMFPIISGLFKSC